MDASCGIRFRSLCVEIVGWGDGDSRGFVISGKFLSVAFFSKESDKA